MSGIDGLGVGEGAAQEAAQLQRADMDEFRREMAEMRALCREFAASLTAAREQLLALRDK